MTGTFEAALAERSIIAEIEGSFASWSADTRNEGAQISDAGYTTLVDWSINDEVLAICVSMRTDIPQEHFNALIAKASEVVFEKLAASNPHAV